jgi:hypothetical protein
LESDPLVQDEEVDYALSEFPDLKIAAALILRAIAAKCTREVSISVGSVSVNAATKAQGYSKLAQEYDPSGVTLGGSLVLPRFGGLEVSEKESLDEDASAVQPAFRKWDDDIPEGPK